MSAIAVILNLDGRPATLPEIGSMSSALRSLGEDRGSCRVDGPAAFCFRLQRFTPEDEFEEQPLFHEPSGLTLVADARIDYRDELARELGLSLEGLERIPDSRLMLEAWLKWGPESVNRVLGSWTVTVWSSRQRRLWAACSVGEAPPLYVFADSRRLLLATMPRALFTQEGVERRLNESWLADYLIRNPRYRRQTPWRGIEALPCGHLLKVESGRIEFEAYWSPRAVKPVRLRSDLDYRAAFRERFDRAVRTRLRSRRECAVLLSGGLDSSLIAASAATWLAQAGGRLWTLTQVPAGGGSAAGTEKATMGASPDALIDESPLVRSLAQVHPALSPIFVDADGECFLDHSETLFSHTESPIRNPSNLPWLLDCLREAGAREACVVLAGDLGNEIFSWRGDPGPAWLLREGKPLAAWRQTASLQPAGLRTRLGRFWADGLLPFLPRPLVRAWRRRRLPEDQGPVPWVLVGSPIRAEFAQRTQVLSRAASVGYDVDELPALSRRWERGHVLWRGNRSWLAACRSLTGIDLRAPAADRALAEFCLGLPIEQFAGGIGRRLARTAFTDRVPPAILENRTRGLQGADWLPRLHARRARIAELLFEMRRSPWCREVLDLPRLEKLFAGLPDPQSPPANAIWLKWGFGLQTGLFLGQFLLWVEKGVPGIDA